MENPEHVKLSTREKKVLIHMCEEKDTKEIAEILKISPRTVESIRDKLKVKTGTKSIAGLVIFANKAKLV